MSGILFDTNVLLDIATADAIWLGWSEGQFRAAAAQGPILINPIIYAELAHAEAEGLTLATRDATRYRTYFPSVSLITP
jgi:predicted nucleic acid-binding protein